MNACAVRQVPIRLLRISECVYLTLNTGLYTRESATVMDKRESDDYKKEGRNQS